MTTQKNNTSAAKLQAVKGMNDILPKDMPYWQFFETTAQATLKQFCYENIRTPILEHTDVFVRGIGEVTDIVEKEMYTFIDQLNQESLTLRPEGTAACIRAVNEHHLIYDGAKKLWYQGPMFRHERPQRGRYRQFHQLGIEAIGFKNPDADAELIAFCASLFERLGILKNLRLEINSLGDSSHRQNHKVALLAYFNQHLDELDDDSKKRLSSNPLRILDSKNPDMQTLIENAPRLIDYVDGEAREHFTQFTNLLDALGIVYQLNPRLVRGLDYYNRTVFEWITSELGAQGTVCGGGRYDPLIAMMGGKDAPAVGLAMGIERILELVKQNQTIETPAVDIYIAYEAIAQNLAMQTAQFLRNIKELTQVYLHLNPKESQSFKAQFKKANQMQAKFVLILGEEEFKSNIFVLKNLLNGEQQTFKTREEVAAFVLNTKAVTTTIY